MLSVNSLSGNLSDHVWCCVKVCRLVKRFGAAPCLCALAVLPVVFLALDKRDETRHHSNPILSSCCCCHGEQTGGANLIAEARFKSRPELQNTHARTPLRLIILHRFTMCVCGAVFVKLEGISCLIKYSFSLCAV